MIFFAFLVVPLFLGAFFYFYTSRMYDSSILLFHDLHKHKFPRSLSEFSLDKFRIFCTKLKQQSISTGNFSELRKERPKVTIIFDDGFTSNLEAATILHNNQLSATFFLCTGHLSGDDITDVYGNKERLSAEQIREISTMGFEIGSHTVHHYDLRLLDENTLWYELYESKVSLESIIGKEVSSLSIPYGLWNHSVIETAMKCGYKSIAVYNFPRQAISYNNVFPVLGIYSFDSVNDIFEKLNGKCSFSRASAQIIPHFAKGSPLGAFRSIYSKLPFPWFMDKH